ncbi:serine hydrolase domain-containing protein [Deinococcus cellulosilyticus]|uniref:Penicillin-binding protein n=1 Tax=Deinococcus cellulosilyticus (strain DSM 18568 / NBRC 106333 / KACC 11606 / 5516J-15) TaxID=1223518 RepID=A0A511MW25_DEIC1|nr:serine hydrolase domain-containing protein [Deinococcus cellulosilyticus]GEM44779.1 penicillin-binding protein [Deinococcus cellulosilyticus NBRC 106333 = KACC 11606]
MNAEQLTDWLSQRDLPEPFSGVISFAQGEGRTEKAFGEAIKALNLANTLDTRFQTASGCKIFTAVAILQLIEKGQLTLDTRLKDCLSIDFPHFDPDVTLHHLLTHTSGIPDYFDESLMENYADLWKEQPMYAIREPRDFLPMFQNLPMTFRPGEKFAYNNAGFIVLGLVVEEASGQPFTQYIEQHIFEPAGMTDSGYFWADSLPERTAYAYLQRPDGSWGTNVFSVPIVGGPDGGAYTTTGDLEKFWKALAEGKLVQPDLILQPRVSTGWKPPYTHYGYGVWVDLSGDQPHFFVEGSDPGVALRSRFMPDRDAILTVMGNTQKAMWAFYGDLQQEVLENVPSGA